MGGTSTQQQQQQQKTDPWAPAQPALKSILGGVEGMAGNTGLSGNQSGAIAGLEGNASKGNPYAAGIGNFAHEALTGGPDRTGMVGDAYSNYTKSLQPTINGDYLDPNTNPFFAKTTSAIGNDVWNRMAGLYAGSGRDPAGAGNFGYNVSRGIGDATAPIYADTYNRERTNQLNASGASYGAGNTSAGLLSGLDSQRFANMGTGVNAASAATGAADDPFNRMLAAEAQKRGIPLSLMSQLAGIAGPLAGLGGTSSGTSSGSSTMSGAQQFGTIAGGMKSMVDPMKWLTGIG